MFVTLEKKGPVGIVTMNRPEALNALDRQVLEDLNAVLNQVEADPEILVAVVLLKWYLGFRKLASPPPPESGKDQTVLDDETERAA